MFSTSNQETRENGRSVPKMPDFEGLIVEPKVIVTTGIMN